jgi:type IV secretory pathway TrbL component
MENIFDRIAVVVIVVLFILGLIDFDLFMQLWVKIFIGVLFVGLLFRVTRGLF